MKVWITSWVYQENILNEIFITVNEKGIFNKLNIFVKPIQKPNMKCGQAVQQNVK